LNVTATIFEFTVEFTHCWSFKTLERLNNITMCRANLENILTQALHAALIYNNTIITH